jgi:hypothetical protein
MPDVGCITSSDRGHLHAETVAVSSRRPSSPAEGSGAAAAADFDEQCAWLVGRFDKDGDGALNRAEYKEFLKSIDVWGHTDAYTDVYWGWTWRRICEQASRHH